MRHTISSLTTTALFLGLVACGTTPDQDANNGVSNNGVSNNGVSNNGVSNNGVSNNNQGGSGEQVEPPGIALLGSASYDSSPDISAEVLAELTAGNRALALNLMTSLRELEGDDQNLFISPHSISLAMAMAYAGAENTTRAEMAEALSITLEDAEVHRAFNALSIELGKRSQVQVDDGDKFTLNVVNQAWAHETFQCTDEYLDILSEHYRAGLRQVDFETDFEQVREGINRWVESNTNDRIKDLLAEGTVNQLTRFILVNAIYFYGSWATAFEPELTQTGAFAGLGGPVDVPMMRQVGSFGYFADEATVAVSMPYVGGQVSLVALMPADEEADFVAWENSLTREGFDAIAQGVKVRREVDLTFPKFQTKSGLGLKEAFNLLGMEDAFEPELADFERLTGVGPGLPGASLYISDIIHQSFVSIDEDGTEAAAATAVIFGGTEAEPDPPVVVRFDRPFYYAIYDHPTDTILFVGRLVNPA